MAKKNLVEKVENENALKHLYNRDLLKRIADSIGPVEPSFDRKHFMGLISQLEPLEMKPRVRFLRDELHRQLPSDFPKALKILMQSLKSGKLRGFDLWPYTEFVQTYGMKHPELSLEALKKLTVLFTSEWAVRPFIRQFPKETLDYLQQCARDSDSHVRRWASEGSRPRLPWGERLQDFVRDPSPTLPILELLKFDPELYVRKSVSNHLNDIAKDHPELVVKLLTGWKKEAGTKHADKVDWIIRRSLRTLIKDGHAGALKLIGISQKVKVQLVDFKVTEKRIKMGDRIHFEFQIQSLSNKPHDLVVDYIIHFVKSNKRTAPKVFKLKMIELPAKAKIRIEKQHHIKKITTRQYYSGLHVLEIQINGIIVGKMDWHLQA